MRRNVDIKNYMQQQHAFIIQTATVAAKLSKEDTAGGKQDGRAGFLSPITPYIKDVL
jgi:hypothetical protein